MTPLNIICAVILFLVLVFLVAFIYYILDKHGLLASKKESDSTLSVSSKPKEIETINNNQQT
jgi:hypothetical protein